MKKIYLFLFLSMLLLAGCNISGTVDVNPDSITITSLSSTSKLVEAGDQVSVYFGFTASEYITQNDVNIIIKNSAGVDVTSTFEWEVSHFTEMSSTAASEKCYYTVKVDSNCVDGIYTVDLDITVGTKKDTKSFALYVGVVPTISIQSIETAEIVAGSIKTDTIKATVLNGLFLSKDDFTVTVDGTGGKPTVKILSYVNGILSMEVSAQSAPTGLFSCILSITDHAVSKGFTLSVVDVETAQIVSVENLTLDKGSSATTSAVIASGSGLTTSDFKVVVAGSGSSSSTTVSPTASVTSFINGVATIIVNATSADAGTFYATLSVGGSAKNFVITVTEQNGWVEISDSELFPMEIAKGSSETFTITIDATEYISDESLSYTVSSGGTVVTNSGISLLGIPNFNTMDTTITLTMNVAAGTAAGSYSVTITATGVIDSDNTSISVEVPGTPATIASVDDASLVAGGTTTTTAAIVVNDDVLTTSSFSVSFPSSINTTGTVPSGTVSAYANGTATISIDATNATPGTYTGTLTIGTDSETFTVTVESNAIPLTEKRITLYNPYSKDGYNSAFNLMRNLPVAGVVASNGKMDYASSDSAVADLAVDNTMDIRDSKIVTELTSINGGLFYEVNSSDYTNATDVSFTTLCESISFTDNEAIMFSVGSVYAMKLASYRGYVIFKITSIDEDDTDGSPSNTGSIGIAYKYLSL